MDILCPIRNKNEVNPLVDAGGDIFYGGVNSEVVFGKEKGVANRWPWPSANFGSKEELKKAVKVIQARRKKFNITLNEHFYSPAQITKITKFIKEFDFIDGFIVADINLILQMKVKFPKINIVGSTGLHILNKEAVGFFRDLGITKVVLPRHQRVKEIKELVAHYKGVVDFECFVKNNDCANIDGLCSYSHGLFEKERNSACEVLCNFKVFGSDRGASRVILKRYADYQKLAFNQCGACAIFDFQDAGIRSLKIIGRNMPLSQKIKDVMFIRKALAYLRECSSKEKFSAFTKETFRVSYGQACRNRCYYK